MNILYIGPFQNNSNIGVFGKHILTHMLNKNNNVYAYPIYGKQISINHQSIFSMSKFPDVVIQHCYVQDLHLSHNSKTYFIPIIDQLSIPEPKYYNKLKCVDKIIVTNNIDYNKFLNIGIDSNNIVKLAPFNFTLTSRVKDINIYQKYDQKYYFACDYSDVVPIKFIINNFLQVYGNKTNVCLLISCNCEYKQQQEIIEYYKKAKDFYKLREYQDVIIFTFDKFSEKSLSSIHETCNICILLNNNYSFVDYCLATQNENYIIDYQLLDLDSNNVYADKYSIINKSLQDVLINYKNFSCTNIPSTEMSDILC